MAIKLGNITIKSDIEQAIAPKTKRITIKKSKPLETPGTYKKYKPPKKYDQTQEVDMGAINLLFGLPGAVWEGYDKLINFSGGLPPPAGGGGSQGGEVTSQEPEGGGTTVPPVDYGQTAIDLGLTGFGGVGLILNAIRGLSNEGAMTPVQFGSLLTSNLLGIPGATASLLGMFKAEQGGVQGVAPPSSNIFVNPSPSLPGIDLPDLTGLGEWGNKILLVALILGGVYIGGKLIK